jgi:hypothetical protein
MVGQWPVRLLANARVVAQRTTGSANGRPSCDIIFGDRSRSRTDACANKRPAAVILYASGQCRSDKGKDDKGFTHGELPRCCVVIGA